MGILPEIRSAPYGCDTGRLQRDREGARSGSCCYWVWRELRRESGAEHMFIQTHHSIQSTAGEAKMRISLTMLDIKRVGVGYPINT